MDRDVDFKESNGKQQFNIYMILGVNKKRCFLTGWIIEPGGKPRIVTTFRKEERMIEEFECVRVKKSGITGVVVDIYF